MKKLLKAQKGTQWIGPSGYVGKSNVNKPAVTKVEAAGVYVNTVPQTEGMQYIDSRTPEQKKADEIAYLQRRMNPWTDPSASGAMISIDPIGDAVNPLLVAESIASIPGQILEGDYFGAGMNALEALPFAGSAFRGLKRTRFPHITNSNVDAKELFDFSSTTSNSIKIDPTKLEDAKGFLKRRQFIKGLQKEGLIGKDFNLGDVNYAARSTDKTNKLTQFALNREATRFRGVKGSVPKDGKGIQDNTGISFDMSRPHYYNEISEFENMKNAGVDFNDPLSIAKYQASHVPMEQYGYTSGLPDNRYLGGLYLSSTPNYYGNYQIRMTSPRDYSTGNYQNWFNKYFHPENNFDDLSKGFRRFDFNPVLSYERPMAMYKGSTNVMGKRGSKMFDVDESFPFMDYKNLTPEQNLEFKKYIDDLLQDYKIGWRGKYKNGGSLPKYQDKGSWKGPAGYAGSNRSVAKSTATAAGVTTQKSLPVKVEIEEDFDNTYQTEKERQRIVQQQYEQSQNQGWREPQGGGLISIDPIGDAVNPLLTIEGLANIPSDISEGNYLSAGMNALEAVPFLGAGFKGAKQASSYFNKIDNALLQIEKEGLQKGLTQFEIAKEQMEKLGITSKQRKGYLPIVSELLTEYVVPYSYDNATKRILQIPQKIILGKTNSKILTDDISKVIMSIDTKNPLVSTNRYDAWRLYSGLPQKYNTFRIAETAPINHPAYTPEQLKNLEIFSINNENRLLNDLPNIADLAPWFYYNPKYASVQDLKLLKEEKKKIDALDNSLQTKESDFTTTNIMGGYNQRFYNNVMEYNDIWDLVPGNVKLEKFFGKPFMSHGVLEYSPKEFSELVTNLIAQRENNILRNNSVQYFNHSNNAVKLNILNPSNYTKQSYPMGDYLRHNVNSAVKQKQKNGGMIRRKDGSYSRRGLWDNIRDNAGSGKKPTAEMLKQERKIRNEKKEMGGFFPTSTTGVPYQDKEYMYQGGGETENWLTKLLNTPAGNILKQTLADQVNVVGPAYNATTQILENNPSDYARTVNIALEGLKSPAPFWGDLAINALQEGVSYMGKKNPVGIDRSYETHFKNEKGPKYREGGENPEDWTKFTAFNKTLPNNLRDDNFKYGDYSYYDLYGMWEAAGKPNSFKEVKDTEFFPLQDDGLYHGFSVGKDGIVLKSKNHPSVVYEALASQLSPYTKDLLLTQREDGRLQYVPKKQAGGENLIDMYYKGSNYPYRIKDETKRNEHIKNIFFRDLDEIPREYLTEENIEQVKNFFRKKYRGYGTERGYDVGDNYIGFDYKDFDDKMFAKLVEEYLDQVYSDEAPLIVTNGIESILAKQRKNRAKKRDGGSSSEIDPWVEYHKKLKLYNQYNNEEQPEYELIIDKNTFPNEFEEYTQHDEAVKKYTQQAFDNEDLFVKEFAKKYGLETERKTSKDSLRIKGRVPESLSEEFYKGKVKVLEDIMESKDYKDRLNRKYYLNNMYARPNVKLNEYWKTKKDPNFSVDGIKPTSWEEKIIEQGRTMVPIGSNSYGTIYGQPVGNPTTTESTTYYKPIFQKPLMPKLKKMPLRNITQISYDKPEREFVPLDIPIQKPARNPPQKFYYGMDKKQEKRRLAGKPYTALNSSGNEIYIASGDTRLDSDPENTIGYNKGRAYVEGDRMEEFEPTRDTQNNPISKEQMGGNIYDKETDNLLAQIASMIADGEDPDMLAGSLVDTGYSEEVVDSLVEEAIDRLSELGDYEEEDINQIEDIKVLREGGIPDRYKNQGFTKVGAKRKSNRPGKKWMVLAKKGNKYKIVHGGYKGMKDYTQHGSEERRERFWDRMGGKNSAKAKDQFSPLYWHKRFGTWQDGGKTPIEHPEGQRKFPGKTTRIPSNRITMEGINYPVLAIGDNGKANLMLPGEEYLYLGVNYVDEVPFSK
jgi:hypothetical protein